MNPRDEVEKDDPKKYTQEEFSAMYLELCKQTHWQLAGSPVFKAMNDLGGSLITVQFVVVPYEG